MFDQKKLDFKEPRIFLFFLTILLVAVVLFYCVASMITSVGYQTSSEANNFQPVSKDSNKKFTIILDAGHGGEDPGAIVDELKEKNLNLTIVNKLASFLNLSGYQIVLTRSDDRLLYNSGEEGKKKYFDLYNRYQATQAYPNAIFISIHMNKFPSSECQGLQTFYSLNHPDSKVLAEAVQKSSNLLTPDNNRTIKADQNLIFLLKKLQIPAILIECGFLSNPQDASNLSDEAYQDKLAFSLYIGICEYLEEMKSEN